MIALQAADILAFMTYDEHWEESNPGPPASLPWVRDVLEYAISEGVNPQKIFMGIPLYGYDWPMDGDEWATARGIEYDEVVWLANSNDTDVLFNPVAQVPHFSYISDGTTHNVWFENAFSFEEKFDLAKEFGLGGIMLWRQGREDTRIYEVLSEE